MLFVIWPADAKIATLNEGNQEGSVDKTVAYMRDLIMRNKYDDD